MVIMIAVLCSNGILKRVSKESSYIIKEHTYMEYLQVHYSYLIVCHYDT